MTPVHEVSAQGSSPLRNSDDISLVTVEFKGRFARRFINAGYRVNREDLPDCCEQVNQAIDCFLANPWQGQAQETLVGACERLEECLHRWAKDLSTDFQRNRVGSEGVERLLPGITDAGGRLEEIEEELRHGPNGGGTSPDSRLMCELRDFEQRLLPRVRGIPSALGELLCARAGLN